MPGHAPLEVLHVAPVTPYCYVMPAWVENRPDHVGRDGATTPFLSCWCRSLHLRVVGRAKGRPRLPHACFSPSTVRRAVLAMCSPCGRFCFVFFDRHRFPDSFASNEHASRYVSAQRRTPTLFDALAAHLESLESSSSTVAAELTSSIDSFAPASEAWVVARTVKGTKWKLQKLQPAQKGPPKASPMASPKATAEATAKATTKATTKATANLKANLAPQQHQQGRLLITCASGGGGEAVSKRPRLAKPVDEGSASLM